MLTVDDNQRHAYDSRVCLYCPSGVRNLISVYSLVYRFIGIENDSNSSTQQPQRHCLFKTAMKKVSNNKSCVESDLVRYKSHNTNSIPKQSIKNDVRYHT